MKKPLRVLIIDDSENDAVLVLREIRYSGYDVTHERVDTAADMKTALEKQWDIIISDFVMPQFGGLEALKIFKEKGIDLPFIVVSGKIGEDIAVSAMKAGAHDYIMKANLKRLGPAIERELRDAQVRQERRKAEERLAAYQEDLRSLASELSLAEERERHRIAVELHDRTSQILAFCVLRMEAALRAKSGNPLDVLTEIHGHLKELATETRSLTFELSPPVLYDLGLEVALKELGEKMLTKYAIEFVYYDDEEPKLLDKDVRVLLFQSVRELLVNIIKHAKAKNVIISTNRENDEVRITVEDDGVGFDPAICSGAKRAGGFGLFSIRERLNYIGGYLQAEPGDEKGSRIILAAPMKKTEKEKKEISK